MMKTMPAREHYNAGVGASGGLMKALWAAAALQLTLSIAAFAQSPPAPGQPLSEGEQAPSTSLDEVTVTATRIQRTDFTAPTPTTILSAQDLVATGATNIGDMTSIVPAFQSTGTPTSSVLASDTGRGHFLDLRGLGPSRTLVLVDGQRFVPTTANGLLDTDVIPAGLVDHVEVVTGGASASWGSDAVSGVVNIILKKEIDGLEGNVQEGISAHGDNQEFRADLAYGLPFADGRGHFEVAGEFSDNRGILHQSDRRWSAQEWGYVQTDQYVRVPVTNARLSIASYGGLILSGPLAGMQFGPGGALQPFQYGNSVGSTYMQGGDGAVFSSFSALEVPLKRTSVFARTSFDVTDNVSVFLDASFAQAITYNPNLVQNFDLVDTLSTDNAFLPPNARNAMLAAGDTSFLVGRLDNDFGFIRSNDDNRVARVVTGLNGKFAGTWTWNAYLEYGHVVHYNTQDNVVLPTNYAQALDSVLDPVTGSPVCRSTLTTPNDGCVPINIFGVGSPSAAALKYVTGNESTVLHYTQRVAAASLQGEPFNTWAGPASIATGFEYRRESADSAVDPNQEAGNYLIGNQKSFEGDFNVKEGFFETVLPVVAGPAPFKSVDLDLGARLTDYSSSGRVTTWKGGFSYTISEDLRLRATRSRDIRAPNLSELYQTGSLNFTNVNDPAAGSASAFIRNPAPPNANLQPEKADTTTIGLIYQPKWVAGLHTSVDAYDINLKNVISQLAPQDVLNRCTDGDTSLCSLVHRDGTGALTEIDTPFINLAQFHTRGLDIEARYDTSLSSWSDHLRGKLTLRALANYVDLFAASDGLTTVNEAGAVGAVSLPSNLGATGGVPHWRANVSANYGLRSWSFYVEGRFIGSAKIDNLYGPSDIPDNHVSAVFYMNTSVNYTLFADKRHELQLYGVINNVFDRYPPIIVSTFISPQATNPALYDVIGRTFVLGVRFRQ
jgi:iron complex outermembrane recepter protein